MKINKLGFSLIEIVIATSIITITVFGIYRLMGENTKIISNSSEYVQSNSLFPILQECLEYKGLFYLQSTYNIGDEIYFYLGNSGSLDECNNQTSIIYNTIDSVDYILKSTLLNKETMKYTEWELEISSDRIKTSTGYYKQIKKS